MPRRRRPPGEGRLIQLVYYAYVAGSAAARALPEPLVYGAARAIGRFAARVSKKRDQVACNLARVVGEPPHSDAVRALVPRAYESYARYWLETFRLVREGPDFFLDRFQCTGFDKVEAVAARGKGAIVVVGHLGNWDAAGGWVAAKGYPVVTVAEVLRPRRMFEFFVAHRARLGMTIHPAERGVTAKLLAAVEDGSLVAILGDRDLNGTGPTVAFFGEEVTFPAGPASLALRAGVPLLVAGIFGVTHADGRRGWQAEISGPIEPPARRDARALAALTQEVATHLERFVARRPEEWHVFQPFWPADKRAPAR